MATLFFKLRHVPEDEANEVRELLDIHDIEYYETSAGNWRISMPAIWLSDDQQVSEARQLLDQYQKQRYEKARLEFEEQRLAGQQKTFWSNFLRNPFQVTFYLALVVFVIYLSLQVFLSLI